MPCVSGQAKHILCKPGCPEECPCTPVRAFSVRKICCRERRDEGMNTQSQDVTARVCKFLMDYLEANSCTELVDDIVDGLPAFANTLPDNHCKTTIEIYDATQECVSATYIFENKEVTTIVGCRPDDQDIIQANVNGKFCLECTFIN